MASESIFIPPITFIRSIFAANAKSVMWVNAKMLFSLKLIRTNILVIQGQTVNATETFYLEKKSFMFEIFHNDICDGHNKTLTSSNKSRVSHYGTI